MSLDKAIENGKEHRKKYRGAKSIDSTCRNHGSCLWCRGNRLVSSLRRLEMMEMREMEMLNVLSGGREKSQNQF